MLGTSSLAQNSITASAANSITFTTFSNNSFYFPQNVRVEGTFTAQQINTEFVSSSIIYESGSTKFGDSLDDTHNFTGSLQVTGSVSSSNDMFVGGNLNVNGGTLSLAGGSGMFRNGNNTIIRAATQDIINISTSPALVLRSTAGLAWSLDTNPVSTQDLVLARDAADTLAQRRTTNPQTFRIYNTFTDASNFERAKIAWSGSVLQIGTEQSGSGAARTLELQTSGSTRVTISTTGTVTTTADIRAGTNLEAATAGVIYFNNRTALSSAANGVLRIANQEGTDFGRLQFGGLTAAFPSLKRVSSSLNIRLADDSGDAGLIASFVSASSYTSSINNAVGFFGTSSWANAAISSSYAETSSVTLKVRILSGSVGTGVAIYTGSFSGSFVGDGTLLTNVSTCTISGSAPTTNLEKGDLWYDDTSGKTYIYYVSASVSSWVLQSDPTIPAPTLQDLQDITDLGNATTNAIQITNSTNSTSTGSGALIVSGGVGIGGNVYVGQTVTQLSDIRLKSNITPITEPLALVKQLEGIKFSYKSDLTQKQHIGFIAQQVKQIVPELVYGGTMDDSYQGISYGNITALLVEAIKEQQKQIDELKIKLDEKVC